MNLYSVRRCSTSFSLSGNWNGPEWQQADLLTISHFLPESTDHRPVTRVKLLYSPNSVRVFFKVTDRFVRCVHTGHMAAVWNDSCVEWFVGPRPGKGYFNFEINCGGSLYASYVEDPKRGADGKPVHYTSLPAEDFLSIEIFHSMPSIVEQEITGPVEWLIELNVPITVFESFVGPVGPLAGQEWRANFYKCGDATSHPHWAAWSPVSKKDFHRPHEFGTVRFG
jgi:hypothetical protein